MKRLIVPAIFGVAPLFAQAQSLPENLSISGELEISSLHSNSDQETFSRGSIDIVYDEVFGNFGLSLGVDAYSFNGNSDSVIYPAITYNLGDHRLSFGMTRSVLDNGYLTNRKVAGTDYFDFDVPGASGSFLQRTLLLSGLNFSNIGLRFDGVFGDTMVGASYNRIQPDGLEEGHVYGVAFRHQLTGVGSSAGDLALYGAFEHLDAPAADLQVWSLGVEGAFDKFGYGFGIGDTDDVVGRYVRGWVEYDFTDKAQVSAEVFALTDGTTDTFYTVAASYNIWNGLYLKASFSEGDTFPDPITEISLRYELFTN